MGSRILNQTTECVRAVVRHLRGKARPALLLREDKGGRAARAPPGAGTRAPLYAPRRSAAALPAPLRLSFLFC